MAAEQNPSEITTAAIAKRMKLTQGAIFRHFPSKDSIWQAVMEWLERLHAIIEEGKSQGEIVQEVDTTAAVSLFIGMIQGLIMQSLIAGDIQRMRNEAPGVFAIYRRGIGGVR